MNQHRAIEIDFDVHKRIEAERTSFAETPNDVLRRLLSIDNESRASEAAKQTGRSWTGKGLTLPEGTQLQMDYNGRTYNGVIADGQFLVEGKSFPNPSPAASGVAKTKSGISTQLDGWKYWQVKRPGDDHFITIASLRPKRFSSADLLG